MARKRMIDPDFWSDEALGSCKPLARLLFMGLISQADDEGRLRGTPSLIRSQVFPYDDDISGSDVAGMIAVLTGFGLILPYEVDEQRYIHIVNFSKHQTINKPTPSRLPPPPETPLPDNYGSPTVALPPKLIEEKRKEDKGREEKTTRDARVNPVPKPVAKPRVPDPMFEALCLACYRKPYADISDDERGIANKAALSLREVPDATPDEILSRVNHYTVMWPELDHPSPQALSRNWTAIGNDVTKRQNGTANHATNRERAQDIGALKRAAFAGGHGESTDTEHAGGRARAAS